MNVPLRELEMLAADLARWLMADTGEAKVALRRWGFRDPDRVSPNYLILPGVYH